jgi:DNA-directed RNA polymerase
MRIRIYISEYTHDKWCTVAYLKQQVEKKMITQNNNNKQKNIYMYRQRERRRISSVEIYVHVDVANISVVLVWITENRRLWKRKERFKVEYTWWCCC